MKSAEKVICLIHFQPIEYYPPAMNLINSLVDSSKTDVFVLSTYPHKFISLFCPIKLPILRYGKQSSHIWQRYRSYFQFNFMSFIHLIIKRPNKIICIETLSILPVYIYRKIFSKTKIFLHFHEYTSNSELKKASSYFKFLYYLENKLYSRAEWISHTNKDRLSLFINDHHSIKFKRLEVLANYPPVTWSKQSIQKTINNKPLKIVYIGAFSNKTMYVNEFAEWVVSKNGSVQWDIYSNNFDNNTRNYINELNSNYINFYDAVEYYLLHSILSEYDVGVILYRGHILNYVYNAPNKLFEYLACNLDVWYPKELLSCKTYKTINTYSKVIEIDFNKLDNFNLEEALDKQNLAYEPFNKSCEAELKKLLDTINA